MKLKYLSEEDKQTLRILRHTSEISEIVEVVEQRLKAQPTLYAVWEYRKWFFMMEEGILGQKPILIYGLIIVYILSGRLQEAQTLLEQLPKHEKGVLLCKLFFPGYDFEQQEQILLELKGRGAFPDKNMILTAGRPSIINGVWDLTPYVGVLEPEKERIQSQLELIFGEIAPSIYSIARAEQLYYQNKCYEALVLVVGLMPFLKEHNEMQFLFVALTLEVFIMVQNGQISSTVPMMDNVRKQIRAAGAEEYLPNIDALDAWAAMYDGDYTRVTKWMREGAPDEYGKFCMLDLFRYLVKMRAYIIQEKYLAVTNLAIKLLPLLEAGKRFMDLCELQMLWTISDYAAGRKDEAFEHLEKAMDLSEKYHYDRLLADEGQRLWEIMKAYKASHSVNTYFKSIIEMTEKSALLFPRYLKCQLPKKPALTEAELRILRLLQYNYTNAQIAEEIGIALETVKKHCKHIIDKLEVKNRHQAVARAIEYGILESVMIRT